MNAKAVEAFEELKTVMSKLFGGVERCDKALQIVEAELKRPNVYDQENVEHYRDIFEKLVKKVFEEYDYFFDFIEDCNYNCGVYDFMTTDGMSSECYLVNRNTGQYVNWYKFTHLGRDIHTNMSPDELEQFLIEFKNSSKEDM